MKKPWEHGPLKVSQNKRYLVTGDQPFYWMGDTAWLMLHKLSREEMATYLRNRADKGYNVIQCGASHSYPTKNFYGHLAVKDGTDYANPVTDGAENYWTHVDYAFDVAEELGLYIALLPQWGGIVSKEYLKDEAVAPYIQFLIDRYGKRPNIIWMLGGDVRGDVRTHVFDKEGEMIRAQCPDRLICFHPFGRTSSSLWFADRKWLDMYMFQSGHRRYDQVNLRSWDDNSQKEGWFGEDNWKYVLRDHATDPIRPTVDGEPSYEQIPQGLHDPNEPRWQDHHVRRYAYWSVLAGACGFTYGANGVMQFSKPTDTRQSYGGTDPWYYAIHYPASAQVVLLKKLMERFPYQTGMPAQDMIAGDEGEKHFRVSVFAGKDFALAYDYMGKFFSLKLGMISGKKVNAWWFDPSSGGISFQGTYDNEGVQEFKPAKRYEGQNDALLILCDSEANYI